MTRVTCLTYISLVFLAAQTNPDLTGVWEWYKAKEAPGASGPDSMQVKIDREGATLVFTIRVKARGQTDQQILRYVPGAETKNQMRGAPMTSRADWDSGALVVRSVTVFGGRELRATDRFTLSSDGATLTFAQRNQFGAESVKQEVHTFDRRPANSWDPDAAPKLAEEVYRNIQIMKGVPAPRLQIVMANLNKWLGVECTHCHVPGEFERDDKPAKQTTRKMFLMVRAIGQDHFPGANPVTCWTCHRGSAKPQSLPPQ